MDSVGDTFIAGDTSATNLPVINAFQSTNNGESAFVTRLCANGKIPIGDEPNVPCAVGTGDP